MASNAIARLVLLGPNAVARAAARQTADPTQAWMLRQPRPVRESFARTVLVDGAAPNAEEIWMLRAPDEVRESYIREVLERDAPVNETPF
jgi:hypothetical protein